MADNDFVIITGMSGAGKSQAANAFEDLGYFCIDNIPPVLIPSLVDLNKTRGVSLNKIAVTADLRGGELFNGIEVALDDLKKRGVEPCVIYLDANDTELVRRYTENRRVHPLTAKYNITLSQAIMMERELLLKMHAKAKYIIDTTHTSNKQLKKRIADIVTGGFGAGLYLQCMSFGFKYGIPGDTDLVFDARCLPNPFYIDSLRNHTGRDKEIADYLNGYEQVEKFVLGICSFVDEFLPYYRNEGKNQLVIATGCTGGKHRSVFCTERIGDYFLKKGYSVSKEHRDIDK